MTNPDFLVTGELATHLWGELPNFHNNISERDTVERTKIAGRLIMNLAKFVPHSRKHDYGFHWLLKTEAVNLGVFEDEPVFGEFGVQYQPFRGRNLSPDITAVRALVHYGDGETLRSANSLIANTLDSAINLPSLVGLRDYAKNQLIVEATQTQFIIDAASSALYLRPQSF